MNFFIQFLREKLDLTFNEAKSAFYSFLIIFVSVTATFIYSSYNSDKKSQIVIEKYGELTVPEAEEKAPYTKSEYSKYSKYPKYKKTESNIEIKHFRFNPNTASKKDLLTLGFSGKAANILENYLEKGGKLKYKEDLKKIYGVDEELYITLVDFIDLPEKQTYSKTDISDLTYTDKPEKKAQIYTKKVIAKFDINTADTATLKQINGIGEVFASRIINFREKLGGFNDLDQVSQTYGIPVEVLPEIKKYAFIEKPVSKIKINKVKTIRHPYLKYNQSKAIIAYRNQHGNYNNADDLKKIKILDNETIEKIKPYLEF